MRSAHAINKLKGDMMINIKLTRSQAEDLLNVYEQEGSDFEIIQELKINLGIIKPEVSELEKDIARQLKELFESATVK